MQLCRPRKQTSKQLKFKHQRYLLQYRMLHVEVMWCVHVLAHDCMSAVSQYASATLRKSETSKTPEAVTRRPSIAPSTTNMLTDFAKNLTL